MGQHRPDPVLPQVEGPQLGETGDVLRDGVQVVVVEGQVLQQRRALQQAGGQEGQAIVVQGEGGEGGEAGEGGGRQLSQLVVGEQEDVQVDQVAEAVVGDVGQAVVLEVQDLEVVLLGQCPPLQLGEAVVAEVEGHQFVETSKYSVRQEVTGDVIVRHVQQQQVFQPSEQITREQGEGVVLEEELLQAGGLPEDGGREGGQIVVGNIQEGERQQSGQRVV